MTIDEALAKFRGAFTELLSAVITDKGEDQGRAIVSKYTAGARVQLMVDFKSLAPAKVYCILSPTDDKPLVLFQRDDLQPVTLSLPDQASSA